MEKRIRFVPIAARVLIGLVTFFNLQAAVLFMFSPSNYAPGFELSGTSGNAMIQGMGLLFLMWNIPYIIALINPTRNFISLIEAVIMQAIGVVGESLILMTIPSEHALIYSSVTRFIIFDGAGLLLLFTAILLVHRYNDQKVKSV